MEAQSKPDSERLCRFCFENTLTVKNPLISPCDCKGSQQFIHLQCLNRWRQLNPSMNMSTCFVCKTQYTIECIYLLEKLPKNTLLYKPLQYPYVWYTLHHYVAIVMSLSINNNDRTVSMYSLLWNQELVFHGLFMLFVVYHFQVHKKKRYIDHWGREYRWIAFPFHFFLLFLCYMNNTSWAILTSGLYLPIFWKTHVQILQEINEEDS